MRPLKPRGDLRPLSATLETRRFAAMCERTADYPLGLKVALLSLLKTDLAEKVIRKIELTGVVALPSDFNSLEFARMTDERRRLLPQGRFRAERLAKDLARELGIHHIVYGGGPGTGDYAKCTCGMFTSYARRGTASATMAAQADRHLARVEAEKPRDHILPTEDPDAFDASDVSLYGDAWEHVGTEFE